MIYTHHQGQNEIDNDNAMVEILDRAYAMPREGIDYPRTEPSNLEQLEFPEFN